MPPQIPVIIRRKLDRLHGSLRFYAALDGIALLIFAVIGLFLLHFALDRFFEFPLIVRAILLPVLLGTLVYICWQCMIRRCFAPIRRDQLATLLEHYVPNLNESLITAVDRKESDDTDPELLQQTINQAAAALRGVDVRRFFRTGRLFTRLAFSLFCAALVIAGCVIHSATASLWFSRNILLSQEEYPRRSELLADGFQDGHVRIGRGDSFTLSIRANRDKPLVPDTIRVRIGTPEVGFRTLLIDQFRTETREGVPWRVFTTTFPEMLETVNLYIRGADSTLSDLRIEVVPTPTLTDIVLTQDFPDYMQRPPRAVALTGRTMIPDGTAITITATSTKPLLDAVAVLETADGRRRMAAEFVERSSTDAFLLLSAVCCLPSAFDSLTLTLPPLREETTIDFHLTDIDSLTNRHPIRVELGIIRDQPPVVTARLEGIGHAITPEAVLPIVGEITDDNGLATAMFRYTIEHTSGESPREPTEGAVPIVGIQPGQTIFPLEHPFSVLPLSLQPDDKLILYVEATDQFDLDSSEGQTGTGQRWQLEIVTPEKLKNLLETREITLRQRFEVIIGEVERTKEILLNYSLEPPEQQIQEAEALGLEAVTTATSETITSETATSETLSLETLALRNSENAPAEENEEERQRQREAQKQRILDRINLEQSELGRFQISRMLRDTHRRVYDLTGIVESFRTIRLEMINNRIFTEDERRRLEQEIIRPIQELINEDFPGIDTSLGDLDHTLSERDEPRRPQAQEERQRILDKFDETIWKMTAIRDNMASMESFNEAIELLRLIIRQQQLLRNETIEERNRRLRDLLD